MDSLKAQGLLGKLNADLTNQLGFSDKPAAASNPFTAALVPPSDRYLSVTITNGKAFIDARPNTRIELTISFTNGQRSKKCVFDACVEPVINEISLFTMDHCNSTITAMSDKLRITMVEGESRHLVAATDFDLRSLLMNTTGIVEINGVDLNSGSVVGLLNLSVKIHNKTEPVEPEKPADEVLLTEIEVERRRDMDKSRLFRAYAQRWQEEYFQINDSFKSRRIQPLAVDENNALRSVCSFLPNVDASRTLQSPRLAARFVSCFDDLKNSAQSTNTSYWRSTMSTVLSTRCNAANRACILCGLLRSSFGLDAYVAHGSKLNNGNIVQHYWVLQRDSAKRVTFIEPTSAKRYTNLSKVPYKQLYAVFTDTQFYANVQETDLISRCNFDFEHTKCWMGMDSDVDIPNLSSREASLIKFRPSSQGDVQKLEEKLQDQLSSSFAGYRAKHFGVKHTQFSKDLDKTLAIALNDYEWERAWCATPSPEQLDFVDSIKRLTPANSTFKAKPRQYKGHVSSHRILSDFIKDIAHDGDIKTIFMTRSGGCKHAIRVKMASYAEDVVCTWVLFAAIY